MSTTPTPDIPGESVTDGKALVEAVHEALRPDAREAAVLKFWGHTDGVNLHLDEVLEAAILDGVVTRVLPLLAARDNEIAELRDENERLRAKLDKAYQIIGEEALIDMEHPIPPYGSPEREAARNALRGGR